MKKDYLDIMLLNYEEKLSEVVSYYNVNTLECEVAGKEYFKMKKEELKTLKFFIYEVYRSSKKENILKKRHIEKYGYIKDLEKALDQCLNFHNIAKSLIA